KVDDYARISLSPRGVSLAANPLRVLKGRQRATSAADKRSVSLAANPLRVLKARQGRRKGPCAALVSLAANPLRVLKVGTAALIGLGVARFIGSQPAAGI